MSTQAQPNVNVRASMQRGPAMPGKIEKAQAPKQALARLLPYLNPYRAGLVVVMALVILYTVLGLVGPYLMGRAIDQFIAAKDAVGLGRIALLMLGAYLFSNLFQVAANWLMARISQQALQVLRRDLFGHLQSLSLRFFDTHGAGELISRLTNDTDAINQAVSQNVTALLASVLSMVGILIAMFVLNVWLALATLLVVPIMLAFTEFVARYTRKGFRDLQASMGRNNAVMEEAISGQKVVKAFRRNDAVLAAFREQNEAVYRAGVCSRADADAADQRAGQFLCDCVGGFRRLAGPARSGHGGHDCHFHQLWPGFYSAPAPTGQYVQRHSGGPGRGRARV